jgi:hypothetical protein
VIFTRPDGRPIPAVPAATAGRRQRLHAENRRYGLDITSDTTARHWDGSRLDFPLAIDALVGIDPRLKDTDAAPGVV